MKKILFIAEDKRVLDALNYSAHQLKLDVYSSVGIMTPTEVEMLLPDLILMSDNMEGISGDVLCSLIKKNPKTSHIPVVLLATNGRDKASDQSRADAYLRKPFTVYDLSQTIKQYIN